MNSVTAAEALDLIALVNRLDEAIDKWDRIVLDNEDTPCTAGDVISVLYYIRYN